MKELTILKTNFLYFNFMKPTLKIKIDSLISLLEIEFNTSKKNGNYQECVGIGKAIEIIQKKFKAEINSKK